MKINLSLALWPNARTQALADGDVRPEGIDLAISKIPPPDTFWRQLKFAEFDVSEMSLSSLVMVTSRGDGTWKALPVFPDRRFFQLFSLVRANSDIARPDQLRGCRVAVPEYQQTAALWVRGILEHDFGVRPRDMRWFMERTPNWSHAGAVGFTPPDDIDLTHIPSTSSIATMLREDELDAILVYTPALIGTEVQAQIDRSHVMLGGLVRPLFPSASEEARRAFTSLGFIPMNHCIVVRNSVLERYPWVAANLYEAFARAAETATAQQHATLVELEKLGLVTEGQSTTVSAADVFRYGLRTNCEALQRLIQYSIEQGLSPRLVEPAEFIAPTLLET